MNIYLCSLAKYFPSYFLINIIIKKKNKLTSVNSKLLNMNDFPIGHFFKISSFITSNV